VLAGLRPARGTSRPGIPAGWLPCWVASALPPFALLFSPGPPVSERALWSPPFAAHTRKFGCRCR
jgi:hypothetical protein